MDLCMLASNHIALTPSTDYNTRHRLSSQPSICHQRGMYRSLGHLQRKLPPTLINRHCTNLTQARLPLPLHLTLAQDPSGLPSGQQRLGISKVRQINNPFATWIDHLPLLHRTPLCIPASTSRDLAICRISNYTPRHRKSSFADGGKRHSIRRRRVRPDFARPKK